MHCDLESTRGEGSKLQRGVPVGRNAQVKSRANPKVCTGHRCCCSSTSAILHFKGRYKAFMFAYWREACQDPHLYNCAVIPEKCQMQAKLQGS